MRYRVGFFYQYQSQNGNDNCNGYYFIFCGKLLSRNVKHIQTHNNNKLYRQFVQLRKKHNCSNDFYQYFLIHISNINVLPYIHNQIKLIFHFVEVKVM